MESSLKTVPAVVVALCISIAASLAVSPSGAPAAESGGERSARAMLVLIPAGKDDQHAYDERITARFGGIPGVAVGLVSATQGPYSRDQALLDISQGARVSRSTYDPTEVPSVGLDQRGRGAEVTSWKAILRRAATAPQTIEPGLFAGSIPGGASLVVPYGAPTDAAFPATDGEGIVSNLRQVPADSIPAAAKVGLRESRLTVVVTSPGGAGLDQFTKLVDDRSPGELVIGMQMPPDGGILPLVGIGAAGLDSGGDELTSKTTNLPGMVAGIDIAPTVLDHLGIPVPDEMIGVEISAEGEGDDVAEGLTSFRERLRELGPRRLPALASVAVAWLILFLAAGAIFGRDRTRLPVRRIGGLSVLWFPFVILIPAALGNPSRELELAMIGLLCPALGFLSDRLLPWPRATILPAVFGIGAITLDLAIGSHLINRSVLGPNPAFGARFYGIGNEIQSLLPVLLLAGVAGAAAGREKSRKLALVVLAAGLVLGAIIGSGRLGASVGASITIAVSCSVAAVMVLPGALTGRRIVLLIASPVIGLALLAGLDLLTSDGEGHFIRNVIQEGSPSSFTETVERRTTLAWQQLWRGNMPLLTLIAALAALWAIRNRRIYRPFYGPIWPAALVGGLAGGVVGSFTEDSGPLLLIGAVLTLMGISAYLLGRPDGDPAEGEGEPEGPPSPDSVTG